MTTIRGIEPRDATRWIEMRQMLWPEDESQAHAEEVEQFFSGLLHEPLQVLVAVSAHEQLVGFAELSIRQYAEDCTTNNVAYLEGWYVEPDARRSGVGGALIRAAEDWGRAQGCTEFGSDAELDNELSARAHLALGFTEVTRIRCFRKEL